LAADADGLSYDDAARLVSTASEFVAAALTHGADA
jgi:hypothetical protein